MSAAPDVRPPFKRMAVLGLGLLGGSVAKAARERGLALEVVGAAPCTVQRNSPGVISTLRRMGGADSGSEDRQGDHRASVNATTASIPATAHANPAFCHGAR